MRGAFARVSAIFAVRGHFVKTFFGSRDEFHVEGFKGKLLTEGDISKARSHI